MNANLKQDQTPDQYVPRTLQELVERTFALEHERICLRFNTIKQDLRVDCVRPTSEIGYAFMRRADKDLIHVRASSVQHNLNMALTIGRTEGCYCINAFRSEPLKLFDADQTIVNQTLLGIPISVNAAQVQHPLLPLVVDMVNALSTNWYRAVSRSLALNTRQNSFLQDIDAGLRTRYNLPM